MSSIQPVSVPAMPETIRTPADVLAVLAARQSIQAQKAAAAVLALLDPNVGQNLNVSA